MDNLHNLIVVTSLEMTSCNKLDFNRLVEIDKFVPNCWQVSNGRYRHQIPKKTFFLSYILTPRRGVAASSVLSSLSPFSTRRICSREQTKK